MHDMWGPSSVLLMVLTALGGLAITSATVIWWDAGPLLVVRRTVSLLVSFGLLSVATLILVNQQVHLFAGWTEVWGAW